MLNNVGRDAFVAVGGRDESKTLHLSLMVFTGCGLRLHDTESFFGLRLLVYGFGVFDILA